MRWGMSSKSCCRLVLATGWPIAARACSVAIGSRSLVSTMSIDIYSIGPAEGLSRKLYAPDGVPWCSFAKGSLGCVNGWGCRNPNHRITEMAGAEGVIKALCGWLNR